MVGALAGYASNYIGGALMGLGYTSGAYGGFGIMNTADPLNIHHKSFKNSQFQQISLGMPYGNYGYRRRYRKGRYSRYGRRYRRYGYRRRSYRSRYY